jgi:hypothetical protein
MLYCPSGRKTREFGLFFTQPVRLGYVILALWAERKRNVINMGKQAVEI